jgi:hypothetical protein
MKLRYSGEPQQKILPRQSRIFQPNLSFDNEAVDTIRIIMDTRKSGSWSEIDAIQMKGFSIVTEQDQVDQLV